MALTPVRLLQRFDRCNAGEIAGFPPEVARALIERGMAVPYSRPSPAPVTAPANAAAVAAPTPKGPERPPADKMVKRGGAVTK